MMSLLDLRQSHSRWKLWETESTNHDPDKKDFTGGKEPYAASNMSHRKMTCHLPGLITTAAKKYHFPKRRNIEGSLPSANIQKVFIVRWSPVPRVVNGHPECTGHGTSKCGMQT